MKNYLYALFTVAVWSTTATISKIILTDIPNFEALTVTSSFAVLCLLIINIKSGIINKMREYSLRDYLKMIGLGFIGMFVYTATYNYGITQLTSQEACIINYLWPIMIVLFSSVILKEKMTAEKIISLLCSFVGIIILSSGSGEAATGNALMGIISCVIAAACYGLFSVLNKKANYDQNITMMICWLVVTVCSVAIGPFTESWKMFSSMQLAGFAWIGIVVNGVGYLLWAIALRNESNTAKIANLAYLIPLFSLIISAVVLDEKLTYNALIGFVLVMGGILLQNLRGSKIK